MRTEHNLHRYTDFFPLSKGLFCRSIPGPEAAYGVLIILDANKVIGHYHNIELYEASQASCPRQERRQYQLPVEFYHKENPENWYQHAV